MKKILIVILFFIIIFGISSVCAVDNLMHNVVNMENTSDETSNVSVIEDIVTINENEGYFDKANDEILSCYEFNGNVKENCKLAEYDCTVQTLYEESNIGLNSTEENNLTYINADEILGISSPPSSWYSVRVPDVSIKHGSNELVQISMDVSSTSSEGGYYKYDFYLYIYDSNNNEIASKRYHDTSAHSETFTMASNGLNPGVYSIKIVNYADKKLMRSAKLYVESVPYSAYSVIISNSTMGYASQGSISMTIRPTKSNYYYKYDFYLKIYNLKNVEQSSKRYYSTGSSNVFTNHKIEANTLSPGLYTVKIINNYDNQVMNTAQLTVKNLPYSVYSVHVYDTSINYESNGQIPILISPASNYKYKYDFYLNIYDSNDNQKISQRYYNTTSSTSKIHNVSPYTLNPGVYTIKIINYEDKYVMSTAKLTVKNINIISQDFTGFCDESIHFKVRIIDNNSYKSGLEVSFICDGNEYVANTDNDGYATLNIYLKSGNYKIVTKYDCAIKENNVFIKQKYIENRYRNVKIESPNAIYKENKKITYSFEGNLKGYFNIYKGNSLKYSKKLDTSDYIDDYFAYKKYSYSYAINNLKEVGKYIVKIIDSTGKTVAQSTFEITKAPTISISQDFSTKKGSKETIYLFVCDKNENNKGIGGTAKFKIGGKTYTANVKNGLAQIKVKFPFKVKTYKCSVKFLGDSHYKRSSEKFTIWVKKDSSDIYVDSFTAKAGKKYTIKAKVFGRYDGKKVKSGTVKFKINGKTFNARIKNGVAKVTIKAPKKAKEYKCKATHIGNKKLKGSSTKFTITVKKKKITKFTIKKKITKFTVVVPTKLNKKYSKSYANYKVTTRKYIVKFIYGGDDAKLQVLVYKNGKPLMNFKAKYIVYTTSGKKISIKVYGNYWSTSIGYYNVLNAYKVKAIVWPK